MKNHTDVIIKVMRVLTSPPFLMLAALMLVAFSAIICYNFGHEVGADFYAVTH